MSAAQLYVFLAVNLGATAVIVTVWVLLHSRALNAFGDSLRADIVAHRDELLSKIAGIEKRLGKIAEHPDSK